MLADDPNQERSRRIRRGFNDSSAETAADQIEFTDLRSLKESGVERDSWRCQECGSFKNLQVHHLRPRGRLGTEDKQRGM
jgi:hypothetical protein